MEYTSSTLTLYSYWLVGYSFALLTGARMSQMSRKEFVAWWNYMTGPAELRSANPNLSEYKTVIDIMRAMKIEPNDKLTRRAGRLAREFYWAKFDRRPIMDLREKTKGKGSHDIAVYAPQLRSEIERLIEVAVEEEEAEASAP